MQVPNQNYDKIFKKIPHNLTEKFWKGALYSLLITCWSI